MYLESSIIKNHQEVSRNITAERGCLASMAKLQLVSSKRWPAPPWSSPPWSHGHLYSRAMTSCDPWKNICNCNICPRWDWYQMIPSMIFRLPREVSLSIFLWLASILCKGMQRAVLNWWYVKGMDTMAHVENSECWGAHNLHILAKDPWSFGPGRDQNTLTMFDPMRRLSCPGPMSGQTAQLCAAMCSWGCSRTQGYAQGYAQGCSGLWLLWHIHGPWGPLTLSLIARSMWLGTCTIEWFEWCKPFNAIARFRLWELPEEVHHLEGQHTTPDKCRHWDRSRRWAELILFGKIVAIHSWKDLERMSSCTLI